MPISTHERARCSQCGYRLNRTAPGKCPECGSARSPLRSLKQHEVRQLVLRFLRWCLYAWLIVPAVSAIGALAIAVGSMELYMLAVMFLVTGVMATVLVIAANGLNWTSEALHVWWSVRDGEIGPWSGPAMRFAMWLALVALQLAVAAITSAVPLLLFPEHPAAWP